MSNVSRRRTTRTIVNWQQMSANLHCTTFNNFSKCQMSENGKWQQQLLIDKCRQIYIEKNGKIVATLRYICNDWELQKEHLTVAANVKCQQMAADSLLMHKMVANYVQRISAATQCAIQTGGEQISKTQDELQWIVAQRLLSALTIPGFK